MRKDVRFGLTIGAILLAVLVVYVLVVPADSPEPVSLETLNPDGTVATPIESVGDDSTAIEPGPLATHTPESPAGPAPIATEPAPAAEPEVTRTPIVQSTDEVDWVALLYRNQAAGIERSPSERSTTAREAAAVASPSAATAMAPIADGEPGRATRATVSPDTTAASDTYTVQPNDSLWTISQKVFGDGRYYNDIARANPGINPNRLQVGQQLKLPSRAALTSAETAGRSAAAADAAPIDTARQYRVQSGDSLHRIAQRLYGSSAMADELYQLNRQLIGADPAKLKVGMVLQLPAAPTSATAGAQ